MPPSSSTSSSSSGLGRRRELLLTLGVVAVLAGGDRLFDTPALPGGFDATLRAELGVSRPRPFQTVRYAIEPRFIEGVSRNGRMVFNAQTLRGELFSREARNLLLMGGSTFQCALLDESEMLVARLKARLPPEIASEVRVATSALGGFSVRHSLLNLKQLASDPATRPAMVVGMFGANDLEDFLTHAPLDAQAPGEPAIEPVPATSPFHPSRHSKTYAGWYAQGSTGAFITGVRRAYREHPKVDRLSPGLERAFGEKLQAFDGDLDLLFRVTRHLGAPLLLLTQPMNYGGPRSEARAAAWALWIAPDARHGFIPSPRLMSEMLGRINARVRAFAARHDLPLVDLARDLASCADCFYDQWHFSVRGADLAAERIAGPVAEALKASRTDP